MEEMPELLLELLENSSNPEEAISIATQVILEFLEQLQSSKEPDPDFPSESS